MGNTFDTTSHQDGLHKVHGKPKMSGIYKSIQNGNAS